MSAVDILLIVLLALAVFAAARQIIKRGGCCNGCDGCRNGHGCGEKSK